MQLVDILFFPLVLLGIERIRIVENFTASTHFELVFMPYTHSLLAAFAWAGVIYGLFRILPVFEPEARKPVALAMALGVVSHWFLDLPMHTPDLPLWSDDSLKLGFGLWNSAWATLLIEVGLLLGGFWFYLRRRGRDGQTVRLGMAILVLAMIALAALNVFSPLVPGNVVEIAAISLLAYFALAALAWWLDKAPA